ncbi:hypothetical protein O181_053190 [Austropuccinia psidii MF-1]|uniref:Uncharacterized protein n=1 Tax=Austropuccinia psidii MF-1 TaxID=1389203 RepID=A0A9Q3HTB3_9BASI|nr:hypothetical protein [Austropuccinia psidii MF-1]
MKISLESNIIQKNRKSHFTLVVRHILSSSSNNIVQLNNPNPNFNSTNNQISSNNNLFGPNPNSIINPSNNINFRTPTPTTLNQNQSQQTIHPNSSLNQNWLSQHTISTVLPLLTGSPNLTPTTRINNPHNPNHLNHPTIQAQSNLTLLSSNPDVPTSNPPTTSSSNPILNLQKSIVSTDLQQSSLSQDLNSTHDSISDLMAQPETRHINGSNPTGSNIEKIDSITPTLSPSPSLITYLGQPQNPSISQMSSRAVTPSNSIGQTFNSISNTTGSPLKGEINYLLIYIFWTITNLLIT